MAARRKTQHGSLDALFNAVYARPAEVACREWATVKRLRFWPEQHELNDEVLGFEHLTSLESVGSVFADSIEAVAREHGPRAWIELTNIPDQCVASPGGGWAKLGTLKRQLPKLESVTLSGSSMMDFYFEDLEPFLTSPLFGSLKRLELQSDDVELLIDFVRETRLEHLRCRAPSGLFSFDVVEKRLTAGRWHRLSRAPRADPEREEGPAAAVVWRPPRPHRGGARGPRSR